MTAVALIAIVSAPMIPAAPSDPAGVDPALLLAMRDAGHGPVRVIVETTTDPATVAASAASLGLGVTYVYKVFHGFAASMPADLLHRLTFLPGVKYVWHDAPTYPTLASSRGDVGVPTVAANGWDGTGIRVALLDTGINPYAASMGGLNPSSPGLANKVVICKTYLASIAGIGTNTCLDNHGHGTHTASTVASSFWVNMGMAPAATLAIYKVLTDAGTGLVSDALEALNDIFTNSATNGIRVISMSLGSPGGSGTSPFSTASTFMWDNGFVVVAAAGNDGPGAGTIDSPGDAQKIITVGAVAENSPTSNTDDTIASFSSRGPTTDGRIKPEIVAPGVSINANCAPAHVSCTMSGTSMATPHVAGIAALILEKHPTWTPNQVRSALYSTAVKQTADAGATPNNNYGYGLVWAPGALAL